MYTGACQKPCKSGKTYNYSTKGPVFSFIIWCYSVLARRNMHLYAKIPQRRSGVIFSPQKTRSSRTPQKGNSFKTNSSVVWGPRAVCFGGGAKLPKYTQCLNVMRFMVASICWQKRQFWTRIINLSWGRESNLMQIYDRFKGWGLTGVIVWHCLSWCHIMAGRFQAERTSQDVLDMIYCNKGLKEQVNKPLK